MGKVIIVRNTEGNATERREIQNDLSRITIQKSLADLRGDQSELARLGIREHSLKSRLRSLY